MLMVTRIQYIRIHGVVAQLGERLNGIQEVVGSIPTSSTKQKKGLTKQRLTPFLSCHHLPLFLPLYASKNGLTEDH